MPGIVKIILTMRKERVAAPKTEATVLLEPNHPFLFGRSELPGQ